MVKKYVAGYEYTLTAQRGSLFQGLPAMTRMTREFSLVLLGAGLLTTGYFVYDGDDAVAKEADKRAENRVGGNNNGRRTHGGGFIFIGHFGGGGASSVSGGRSPAMASVSKGGFGSIGGRVGGGTGG